MEEYQMRKKLLKKVYTRCINNLAFGGNYENQII